VTVSDERIAAVQALRERVGCIEAEKGVTEEALREIRAELMKLAARPELFPADEFPSIDTDPDLSRENIRYLLHSDPDQRFTLYLNSFRPGTATDPHDHTTWAVLVAIEGEELNRIYERTDDMSDPERAVLRVKEEIVVKPGTGVCLLPEDIHSVHITGDRSTRHLHMYGLALEALRDRKGFDLASNRVVRHNPTLENPTRR
jgi:predicted metal-dependent enzyme (double-stranded beta helix superfamily)